MEFGGKFGDCSFNCFGFIVWSNRQTDDRLTESSTDATKFHTLVTCHRHEL